MRKLDSGSGRATAAEVSAGHAWAAFAALGSMRPGRGLVAGTEVCTGGSLEIGHRGRR